MIALFVPPNISHAEGWAFVLLCIAALVAIKACRVKMPDPDAVQRYATIANTPGGLIMILLLLFAGLMGAVMLFVVWAIVRNVDPQNGLVILLTGLLSGAIGAVSGALFTAMKGQEPHPAITNISTATTASSAVPPVSPATPDLEVK